MTATTATTQKKNRKKKKIQNSWSWHMRHILQVFSVENQKNYQKWSMSEKQPEIFWSGQKYSTKRHFSLITHHSYFGDRVGIPYKMYKHFEKMCKF